MNYPEFREEIFTVLESMITEDINMETTAVEKLNGCIRHGISFTKEGEMCSPTIYLEPFYRNFQTGMSIEALAVEVLRCYEEETYSIPECIQKMECYETAKENIYVKLIHIEENQNLLQDIPHKIFLDFAIVPYFEVHNEHIFKGSVLIKNGHLEFWGVTSEDVIEQALLYTKEKKGTCFRPMSEVLYNMMEEDSEIYEQAKEGMFVLTNNEKYLGAVLAVYSEVLLSIAKRLHEDFYMLPSSIHEWVVVPKSRIIDEEVLFFMVRDINDTEVMAEEILSYNVYYYDASSQKIKIYKSPKEKIY